MLRNYLSLEVAPNISAISEKLLMGSLREWEGVCSELHSQLSKEPRKVSICQRFPAANHRNPSLGFRKEVQ